MTENEIADTLQNASVPAVQITASKGGSSLSKIGGLPDVPRPFEWPIGSGRPLSFLAQIDLSTATDLAENDFSNVWMVLQYS